MFYYGLALRPAGLGCLPVEINNQEWVLVSNEEFLKKNPNTPANYIRHGVVAVPCEIDTSIAKNYDLVPLNDLSKPTDFDGLVSEIDDCFFDALDALPQEKQETYHRRIAKRNFKALLPLLIDLKDKYSVKDLTKGLELLFD